MLNIEDGRELPCILVVIFTQVTYQLIIRVIIDTMCTISYSSIVKNSIVYRISTAKFFFLFDSFRLEFKRSRFPAPLESMPY